MSCTPTTDAARRTAPRLLALLACAALPLAGCGSQTKTVSAAGTPPATTSTQSATATAPTASTQTKPQTTATATTPSTATTTTAAPTTTRTAPEPAFTQTGQHAEGLSGAEAVLHAHGYAPAEPSQYHSKQTLRVLVGARTGSSDGYGQQAFFFLNGRYLGTDAKEASASVGVVSQNDTEVTLAYPLYRKGDPLSSPSGGHRDVTFALDNGKLAPLGQIPPAGSGAPLSRY